MRTSAAPNLQEFPSAKFSMSDPSPRQPSITVSGDSLERYKNGSLGNPQWANNGQKMIMINHLLYIGTGQRRPDG